MGDNWKYRQESLKPDNSEPFMEYQVVEDLLNSLKEQLAAIEHERWSHWQQYVHSQGLRQADGSLLLPADLVARWDRQIDTEYSELCDKEKESDREQVLKYLPLIVRAIAERDGRDQEQLSI
jgi:hypothetical protein